VRGREAVRTTKLVPSTPNTSIEEPGKRKVEHAREKPVSVFNPALRPSHEQQNNGK
jgi:hypothetical protein